MRAFKELVLMSVDTISLVHVPVEHQKGIVVMNENQEVK